MTKKKQLTVFGRPGILFIILGVISLLSFGMIGSTVDEAGVLHEPFFLMAIGWLLILGGGVLMLVYGILRGAKRD